jgi:hypothetical protein
MNELPEVSPQDVEDGWRLRRLAWGHLAPLAFQSACRHDLFSVLEASGPSTPAELAEKLQLNAEALALLLEALAALELLEVEANRYRNAPISSRMLVHGQPLCQLDIILRKQVNASTVEHSEEVLRLGHLPSPAVPRGNLLDVFAATRESALLSVARVVQAAPPQENEVLLDVAGAPGSYALGYARAAEDLRAIILELPAVAPTFRKVLDQSRLGDRVEVLAGNMYDCPLPEGVTTVLLSNVVHFVDESHLDPLIARLADILPVGGRMILHDSLRGDDGRGPLMEALLALLIMSLSPGIAFTHKRVSEALERAGMRLEQTVDMAPEPGCLLVARKV